MPEPVGVRGVLGPGVGGPATSGVTVMPTTSPVMPCFCTLPIVWRAARVALVLATAPALVVVLFFGVLPGVKPNFARPRPVLPKSSIAGQIALHRDPRRVVSLPRKVA